MIWIIGQVKSELNLNYSVLQLYKICIFVKTYSTGTYEKFDLSAYHFTGLVLFSKN
jgi:hypothetical protein